VSGARDTYGTSCTATCSVISVQKQARPKLLERASHAQLEANYWISNDVWCRGSIQIYDLVWQATGRPIRVPIQEELRDDQR